MTAPIPFLRTESKLHNNNKMIQPASTKAEDDTPSTDSKSCQSAKLDARLARNRTTARLRRERKKMQADTLTQTVQNLSYHLELLNNMLNGLHASKRALVERLVENRGPAPLACEHCDMLFWVKAYKDEHQLKEHANELKLRIAMEAEENKLAAELRKFDDVAPNNAGQGIDTEGNAASTVTNKATGPQATANLTPEERRRRRLERNAASARLCRQRKKMYIENLRTRVPVLKHNVEALRASLTEVGISLASLPKPDYQSIDASLKAANLGSLSGIEKSSVMSTSSDEASHSTNVSPMSPAFVSAASQARLPINSDMQQLQHLQQTGMPNLNLGGYRGVPFQHNFTAANSNAVWQGVASSRTERSNSVVGGSSQIPNVIRATSPASDNEKTLPNPAISRVRAATIGEGVGVGRKRRSESDPPSSFMTPNFNFANQQFPSNLANSMLAMQQQGYPFTGGHVNMGQSASFVNPLMLNRSSSDVTPQGNLQNLQYLMQQQEQLLKMRQQTQVQQLASQSLPNTSSLTESMKKPRCSDPDVLTAAMALFECASVVSPPQ